MTVRRGRSGKRKRTVAGILSDLGMYGSSPPLQPVIRWVCAPCRWHQCSPWRGWAAHGGPPESAQSTCIFRIIAQYTQHRIEDVIQFVHPCSTHDIWPL